MLLYHQLVPLPNFHKIWSSKVMLNCILTTSYKAKKFIN